MNLHVSIAYKPWSSFKGSFELHINYFEMTLHVDIAFWVGFALQVTYITYGLYWNELEYGHCI
jgi:hypothetical protein